MSLKRPQRPPVPAGLITVLIVVAIGVAMLLKPGRVGLLERHVRDRNFEAAAKVLESVSDAARRSDEARYDAAYLAIQRGLADWRDEERMDELARLSLDYLAKHPGSGKIFDFFLSMAGHGKDPSALAERWLQLKTNKTKASADLAFKALTDRALAMGNPAEAGRIAAQLVDLQNDHSVTNAIALLRQGGDAARALELTQRRLALPAATNQLQSELERMEIQLLRETGKPGQALVKLRALRDQADPEEQEALVAPLIQLAREAGRSREVLQLGLRHAGLHPEAVENWELLADLALESGETATAALAREKLAILTPKDKINSFKLAQLREWSQNPSGAFDQYLKALDLTSDEALPRLIALNPGLYRTRDLLDAMGKHPDKVERLELEALHAKLLTGNGKYSDAERILKHHLASHPKDTNAWFDLANTALSNRDYEGAREAFGRFVQLKPHSPAEMGAIARLEGYIGNFDEAFRWAKRAFELEPTDDNLEVYLNTAESLGRTDDLQAALETKAKLGRNASAVVYLRLAGLLASTGQEDQQWETLKAGLAIHPTNALLRAQAAYFHADQQRFGEAAAVLRGSPNIRSDPAQLELYARLLVQSMQLEEADRLLKEPLPREFLEQTSILGMRAYLAENFNRLDEAVRLFGILADKDPASDYYALNHARLLARTGEVEKALAMLSPRLADPTPEVMELAAEVYSASGRIKEAIDWQLRLIAAGPSNLSAAHRVLGDFYLSRGNPIEAKRSYKRALDLFLGTLAMADSPKAAATR